MTPGRGGAGSEGNESVTFAAYLAFAGGPRQPPNPLVSLSCSTPDYEGPNGLFLPEAHQLRWGPAPPALIDGFPGGKRPLGPPKIYFEKNFSMGWVAAGGPATLAGAYVILILMGGGWSGAFAGCPGGGSPPWQGPDRPKVGGPRVGRN